MRRIIIESVLLWRLRPTRRELNPEQLTAAWPVGYTKSVEFDVALAKGH
jgi:hypothetical protein